MRTLILYILIGFPLLIFGQSSFIQKADQLRTGSLVQVVSAPNGGWLTYAMDSLRLIHFDACGIPIWSYRYTHPAKTTNMGHLIPVNSGGWAYVTKDGDELEVVRLDVNGGIPLVQILLHCRS